MEILDAVRTQFERLACSSRRRSLLILNLVIAAIIVALAADHGIVLFSSQQRLGHHALVADDTLGYQQ